MPFVQDFKKFVMRGNVADLAVGFTVGAAFTTVVKSLVDDIIMPPLGLLLPASKNFSNAFWLLDVPEGLDESSLTTIEEAHQAGAVTLNYGQFFNACLSLLIVAFAMYLIVRAINRLDAQLEEQFGGDTPEPEQPSDKKCPYCRSTIPYKAIRCPQCTSDLEDPAVQEAHAATPGPATQP